MDLEYKTKDHSPNSKPQVVRVEFDPPLLGYEEVKPRLLAMKADADEALGTVRVITLPLSKSKSKSKPNSPSASPLKHTILIFSHSSPRSKLPKSRTLNSPLK